MATVRDRDEDDQKASARQDCCVRECDDRATHVVRYYEGRIKVYGTYCGRHAGEVQQEKQTRAVYEASERFE